MANDQNGSTAPNNKTKTNTGKMIHSTGYPESENMEHLPTSTYLRPGSIPLVTSPRYHPTTYPTSEELSLCTPPPNPDPAQLTP